MENEYMESSENSSSDPPKLSGNLENKSKETATQAASKLMERLQMLKEQNQITTPNKPELPKLQEPQNPSAQANSKLMERLQLLKEQNHSKSQESPKKDTLGKTARLDISENSLKEQKQKKETQSKVKLPIKIEDIIVPKTKEKESTAKTTATVSSKTNLPQEDNANVDKRSTDKKPFAAVNALGTTARLDISNSSLKKDKKTLPSQPASSIQTPSNKPASSNKPAIDSLGKTARLDILDPSLKRGPGKLRSPDLAKTLESQISKDKDVAAKDKELGKSTVVTISEEMARIREALKEGVIKNEDVIEVFLAHPERSLNANQSLWDFFLERHSISKTQHTEWKEKKFEKTKVDVFHKAMNNDLELSKMLLDYNLLPRERLQSLLLLQNSLGNVGLSFSLEELIIKAKIMSWDIIAPLLEECKRRKETNINAIIEQSLSDLTTQPKKLPTWQELKTRRDFWLGIVACIFFCIGISLWTSPKKSPRITNVESPSENTNITPNITKPQSETTPEITTSFQTGTNSSNSSTNPSKNIPSVTVQLTPNDSQKENTSKIEAQSDPTTDKKNEPVKTNIIFQNTIPIVQQETLILQGKLEKYLPKVFYVRIWDLDKKIKIAEKNLPLSQSIQIVWPGIFSTILPGFYFISVEELQDIPLSQKNKKRSDYIWIFWIVGSSNEIKARHQKYFQNIGERTQIWLGLFSQLQEYITKINEQTPETWAKFSKNFIKDFYKLQSITKNSSYVGISYKIEAEFTNILQYTQQNFQDAQNWINRKTLIKPNTQKIQTLNNFYKQWQLIIVQEQKRLENLLISRK